MKQRPFVIQFSNFDEFIAELHAVQVDTIRVWPGTYATGGGNYPAWRYRMVNVQAIHTHTILSITLILGGYDELHGRPFGQTAETHKRIIDDRLETAVDLVQTHLAGSLPGISIRPGQIHTGLAANELQPAYWTGFDAIYAELKAARGA